jgi:hypothetical protein
LNKNIQCRPQPTHPEEGVPKEHGLIFCSHAAGPDEQLHHGGGVFYSRCLMWVVSFESYYSNVGKTTMAWIESFSATKYKNS